MIAIHEERALGFSSTYSCQIAGNAGFANAPFQIEYSAAHKTDTLRKTSPDNKNEIFQ